MPFKDPERNREYQRRRANALRAEWFAGKCCEFCGSTTKLEVDHIDPAKKIEHRIWTWSAARRQAELAKCRPLCRKCHNARHNQPRAKPIRHGVRFTYYRKKCRCELCRKANADHARLMRERKRLAQTPPG